jgi:hypothetical protein
MLPLTEARDFQDHLSRCPHCQTDVARFEQVTDALTLLPAPHEPPAELRQRLLQQTIDETALFQAAAEPTIGAPERRRPARRRRVAALLTAAVLVGLGALLDHTLSGSSSRLGTSTVAGTVTPAGGGPRARATVVTSGPVSQLVLKDLAAAPRGRVYQAWIDRGNRTVPTGTLFTVPRTGDTRVSLPSLSGVHRVILTAERPQGSSTPTPPVVAVVDLQRHRS